MGKAVSHLESPLSDEQVTTILSHWDDALDTCVEPQQKFLMKWPCDPSECVDVFGESMVITKKRDLPKNIGDEAVKYINTIVRRYPFQLRQEMSRPMWHRFLDVWNDTGNRRLAMRAI